MIFSSIVDSALINTKFLNFSFFIFKTLLFILFIFLNKENSPRSSSSKGRTNSFLIVEAPSSNNRSILVADSAINKNNKNKNKQNSKNI